MKEDLNSVKNFWTNNLNGLKFIPSFPQNAQEFWEASSLRYKYHYHLPPVFDRVAELFPGAKLLEIGCGMGDDSAQWAKRGLQVTALDLTEPAIECTKQRFDKCGLNGKFVQGNGENLDFPDNTFDIVFSFGVLHHSPNTYKTIQEVHRVLKPGGLAIVMLYHRRSLNYLVHRILHYPFDGSKEDPCPVEHTYTKTQVLEMFDKYSKKSVQVDYLFGIGYGILNALIPKPVHRFLGKHIGWHLMIEATK